MTYETIEVGTARGTMPVYVHRPAGAAGPGDGPLVVLLMDAPGIRPALHRYAERLAQIGYVAALPDLFYLVAAADRPRPELLAVGDADEFKRMSALVASMRDAPVHEDLAAMLEQLRRADAADVSRRWGCVGFCMGGRYALRAAEDFPDDVGAAVLLHPSRIVTDESDSPHLAVDRVRGALYFGWGELDHVSPPELIGPLRARLAECGVEHRVELIPGVGHGFMMRGMPAYDEIAAERAWSGALALLREHLPVATEGHGSSSETVA